jgi:hypothetical protein
MEMAAGNFRQFYYGWSDISYHSPGFPRYRHWMGIKANRAASRSAGG